MILDAPWYMQNMIIQRDLHTPTAKEEMLQLSIQCLPQCTPKQPISELHGTTRQQQAIAKTHAKLSAYQIPSVIVIFVLLVFKV
jgi:hypothetical protein